MTTFKAFCLALTLMALTIVMSVNTGGSWMAY